MSWNESTSKNIFMDVAQLHVSLPQSDILESESMPMTFHRCFQLHKIQASEAWISSSSGTVQKTS